MMMFFYRFLFRLLTTAGWLPSYIYSVIGTLGVCFYVRCQYGSAIGRSAVSGVASLVAASSLVIWVWQFGDERYAELGGVLTTVRKCELLTVGGGIAGIVDYVLGTVAIVDYVLGTVAIVDYLRYRY
ncbi:hypothetical protein FPQ18DRAFT_71216 [Pyronema domesticum]|nr:hypothetical protein FPQ18DRAFT_71216 [Pyronema domesticum]